MHPEQHTASFRGVAPDMEDSVSFISHICDHHDQTLNTPMMLSAAPFGHPARSACSDASRDSACSCFSYSMDATLVAWCCWVAPQTCSASGIASCAARVADVVCGILTLSSNNKLRPTNASRDQLFAVTGEPCLSGVTGSGIVVVCTFRLTGDILVNSLFCSSPKWVYAFTVQRELREATRPVQGV